MCGICNGSYLYCTISILYKWTFFTLYNTGVSIKKEDHRRYTIYINIFLKLILINVIFAFITYIKSIKFMSYGMFFFEFGLNIFPWGISSCLFFKVFTIHPFVYFMLWIRVLWNLTKSWPDLAHFQGEVQFILRIYYNS